MTRRGILALTGCLAALGIVPAAAREPGGMRVGPADPFDATTVIDRARLSAASPHEPPPVIRWEWRDLSYDTFRGIWFDPRDALFRDTDGAVHADFFVAGLYFIHRIGINAVEGGSARPVLFDLDAFARTDRFPDLPAGGAGFAGFRPRGETEAEGRFQEYAVLHGASYFRAIGRGQGCGISARGLALCLALTAPLSWLVQRDIGPPWLLRPLPETAP